MRRITQLFMPPRRGTFPGVILLVLACVAVGLAQRHSLHPLLGERAHYVALFAPVIVAAWFGGVGAGVATVALDLALGPWLLAGAATANGSAPCDYATIGMTVAQGLVLSLLCGVVRLHAAERLAAESRAAVDFEEMADHAPVFVWSADAAGGSGFVNKAWLTFTGASPANRGQDRLALVHPDDLPRVRATIKEAGAAGVPYQIEYRLRRADGAHRWVLEHATPRFDRAGRFRGFTGSGTDITSSRQERDELRFIGELHRALAASLDLQKTAEALARAVVPRMADWCFIQLIDQRDGFLKPVHVHHSDPTRVQRANEALCREPGRAAGPLFSRLICEGDPRHVARVDGESLAGLAAGPDQLELLRGLGVVSLVSAPLHVAGRAVGAIVIATADSGRTLGMEALQRSLKIAGIAAFALENARLYRSTREALAAQGRERREREHSDRRFRSAWDAEIFGVCVVDRAGMISDGNDTFLRLVGHTRADLEAGRVTLRSRVEGRDLRFGEILWTNLAATGRCDPFEKTCVRSDGAEISVLVGGSINPQGGDATVFLLDLSARKAAETELQRQRGLLKTIIDAVPAMVAYIDPEERCVLHNLQYEKWLSLGHHLISGRGLRELVGESAYARMRPRLRDALAGHAVSQEAFVQGAGRGRDVMINYRPDYDARGRVVGVVMHAYDITESRRLAAELARSERRHRTLIHHSAAIVWTADARGVLHEVEGWERFTGTGFAPGTCPMWFRVIHPADRSRVREEWLRPGDGRRSWESVHRMLAADGRYHHVHARAAAIVGQNGEVEEWIGTISDITARVEAEHSLRRKEAELKLVVDTMPALVSYVDRDLRYGLANAAYEKWFGMKPELIRGRVVREVIGEKAYARVAARFEQVMAGREIAFEEMMEFRAGGPRWVSALYTPHRDETGEVLGCFILALDITARKKAEQEMADLAERYRFLADAMPQCVWTADADGRPVYVNRRWCEYTGIPADSPLAGGWFAIVHPHDLPETNARWIRALATGESYQVEHRLRRADGAYHWFLSLALARRDAAGRVVQWVGTATNIDAQRRAYLDLADARAQLRRHADILEREVRTRTARLQEVNEELEAFTYSASHDLRVPLHHVHGFAQAILDDRQANLSPSSHANLRLILNAAERMDRLIIDLLAYSRLSRSEIVVAPTPLEPILNDVLAQHRAAIQANHARVEVVRPLPDVPADRIGLQQILLNLIGNALKFVPPGRRPEIRVRVEPLRDRLRLWVEDNGIGIEHRHQTAIFKLFQRIHGAREYPGTGIGLSLVKRAAARMGGDCGVESELGQGSRFWVDFQPQAMSGRDAPPEARPPSAPPIAKRVA